MSDTKTLDDSTPINCNNEIEEIPKKCLICKKLLVDKCITCEAEATSFNCETVIGNCGHIFHYHCIKRWCNFHICCPLHDVVWSINTKLSPMEKLPYKVNVKIILPEIYSSQIYGPSLTFYHIAGTTTFEVIQQKVEELLSKKVKLLYEEKGEYKEFEAGKILYDYAKNLNGDIVNIYCNYI